MSRVCDLKGNVKDYFLKDGMGKLLPKRVKWRQVVSTQMASLSEVFHEREKVKEGG